MALNLLRGGAIIMAGSGMCNAGRIKHHLKHNLWRKECSVVIVGFQAQGTLGRQIVDGAKRVKVLGEEIAVAADVYTIGGLSAHGDREDLLAWPGGFRKEPDTVLIGHGRNPCRRSSPEPCVPAWGGTRRSRSPGSRSPCDRLRIGAVRPPVGPGRAPAAHGPEPGARRAARASARPAGRDPAGDRGGRAARGAVPTDLPLIDPSGRTGPAGGLSRGGPALLTLNYFTCPMLCPLTFRNLAATMEEVKRFPFRRITASSP